MFLTCSCSSTPALSALSLCPRMRLGNRLGTRQYPPQYPAVPGSVPGSTRLSTRQYPAQYPDQYQNQYRESVGPTAVRRRPRPSPGAGRPPSADPRRSQHGGRPAPAWSHLRRHTQTYIQGVDGLTDWEGMQRDTGCRHRHKHRLIDWRDRSGGSSSHSVLTSVTCLHFELPWLLGSGEPDDWPTEDEARLCDRFYDRSVQPLTRLTSPCYGRWHGRQRTLRNYRSILGTSQQKKAIRSVSLDQRPLTHATVAHSRLMGNTLARGTQAEGRGLRDTNGGRATEKCPQRVETSARKRSGAGARGCDSAREPGPEGVRALGSRVPRVWERSGAGARGCESAREPGPEGVITPVRGGGGRRAGDDPSRAWKKIVREDGGSPWCRHGGGGASGAICPPPTSDRTPCEIDADPRRFSCRKKMGVGTRYTRFAPIFYKHRRYGRLLWHYDYEKRRSCRSCWRSYLLLPKNCGPNPMGFQFSTGSRLTQVLHLPPPPNLKTLATPMPEAPLRCLGYTIINGLEKRVSHPMISYFGACWLLVYNETNVLWISGM